MLHCYFLAPFNGHNRVIYGMGFTNASQTLCKEIGLIKGTTHAHNIFAQVAADNGLFALVAILAIAVWLLKRILRLATTNNHPVVLASASLNLYILLVLQIEGGWGKVTFIQAMMGLTFGSLTLIQPSIFTGFALPVEQDHEMTLNDP
jgi:O-antigen ligase